VYYLYGQVFRTDSMRGAVGTGVGRSTLQSVSMMASRDISATTSNKKGRQRSDAAGGEGPTGDSGLIYLASYFGINLAEWHMLQCKLAIIRLLPVLNRQKLTRAIGIEDP
jgi:hypothetical protein